MSIYTPYTYLIGWSSLNKYYYGVRYANGCNPNDLWTTYYTSSKYVKDFREDYGEPDIIQIRKTFDTPDEAVLWEAKVLSRINASSRDDFLNQQNGSGCRGVLHDSYMKKRKSDKMKAYWTEERKLEKSESMIEYNETHGKYRYTEALKKRYEDDSFKKKFTDKMNVVNKCPVKRRKAGEKIGQKWNEPEYKSKMIDRGGGRQKIPVVIDGIHYSSISEALEKTNLSYHTIRKIAGLVK
jgi:hypothetical protein